MAENVDTDGLEANCEDGEPYYDYVSVSIDVEREECSYFTSNYDDAKIIFNCEHDEEEKLKYTLHVYKNKDTKQWDILKTGIDETINIGSLNTFGSKILKRL